MDASYCEYETPDNPTNNFFDNGVAESLIADYQKSGSPEIMGRIITGCRPIALSLIRSRNTFFYEDENELLSRIDQKLLISVPQFDRSRGTAFSFVSRLSLNSLCTALTLAKKLAHRYEPLDLALAKSTPDQSISFESTIAIDDINQSCDNRRSALFRRNFSLFSSASAATSARDLYLATSPVGIDALKGLAYN